MSYTRKAFAFGLIGLALVGIGAAISNRTPLLRAFLQTNLDGNSHSITNVLTFENSVGDISANATNHDWLIGTAATNEVARMGAANTNESLLIGANATNEVARLGTSITNGAILNLSNLVSTISQNATNEALLVGANATNEVARMGTSITNGAILNISNYVATVDQNSTNNTQQATNDLGAHMGTIVYGGGALNALAANTTNWISINGVAASQVANATTPVGKVCTLVLMRVVQNGNISASTNVTYEIFTNSLAATTPVSTGFAVTLPAGNNIATGSSTSIPLLATYGIVIGQYANGTAVASQSAHWAIILRESAPY